MIRTRTITLLLIAALLATPAPAAAQEPPIPQPPPTLAWDAIPDIIGGVSIAVPQCPSALNPTAPPDPDWWNVGSVLAWLGGWIGAYTQLAICWVLYALQHLINALAWLIHTVIGGINDMWRTLVYFWLQMRTWLLGAVWWFVEIVRSWWMTVALVWWPAIDWLIDAAQQGLAQLMDLLRSIADLVVSISQIIVGALGWVAGLVTPALLVLFAALGWVPGDVGTPPQLDVSERYYCAARGALAGAVESPYTSWMYWLAVAMSYATFVVWVARFLSSARSGGQE